MVHLIPLHNVSFFYHAQTIECQLKAYCVFITIKSDNGLIVLWQN